MENHQFEITGASDKPILIDLTQLNPNAKPLVIFVHGFKGFKDWGTHQLVAEHFAREGFDFLKFNFSHSGLKNNLSGDFFDDLESFENNTISKELFDLNQVITFALSGEKFEKPHTLHLIGHSLGGGISILQTSKDKSINKLSTWASISSFRNLWSPQQEKDWTDNGVMYFANSRTNQQMPIKSDFLRDLNQNNERLEIVTAAQKLTQPWLIVHGENDNNVPHVHALELQKQQPQSELLLLPKADHVFGATHPWNSHSLPNLLLEACNATIQFFNRPN